MVFLTFKDSIVGSINWQTSCLIFFSEKKVFKLIFFKEWCVFRFYLEFECSFEEKNNNFLNVPLCVALMWLKCLLKCALNTHLKVGRTMRGLPPALGTAGSIKVCDLIKFSMGSEI